MTKRGDLGVVEARPGPVMGRGRLNRHAHVARVVRRHWQDLTALATSAFITLACAVLATNARPSNLGVAWGKGDAIYGYSIAKAMIENGWWTPNPDLGYPYIQDQSSFPTPDFVALGTIKVLSILTGDPFSSINLYYLLGFPLAALAAFVLFRVAGVSTWISAVLSIALALIPWHFERFPHTFLSNYAFALIGLALIALVLREAPDQDRALSRTKWIFFGSIVAAVLVGLGGPYYAAFTIFVGFAAILGQFLAGRRPSDSVRSILIMLTLVITLGFAIVISQLNSLYRVTDPITRQPFESELYGGRLYTFFRIANGSLGAEFIPKPLRDLASRGVSGSAWEGDAFNSIITLAAFGLTCTLLITFLAGGASERLRGRVLFDNIRTWLLLFIITSGIFVSAGAGSVFASSISPTIRAWGRASIMITAITMVVLGISLTYLWGRAKFRKLLVVVVTALGVLAIVDPVASANRIDIAFGKSLEGNVEPYVAAAEAALKPGCPVLELPISLFPEVPPTERSLDYSGLIPYLYSSELRWSYGAVKTSEEGRWVYDHLKKPPAEQIELAKEAGFCALQLDMFGYPVDKETQVKETYTDLLGAPIAISSDRRWVMFDLR